jgi:hypothetical protein
MKRDFPLQVMLTVHRPPRTRKVNIFTSSSEFERRIIHNLRPSVRNCLGEEYLAKRMHSCEILVVFIKRTFLLSSTAAHAFPTNTLEPDLDATV